MAKAAAERNTETLMQDVNSLTLPDTKSLAQDVQSVSLMASTIGERGHVLNADAIQEASRDALKFHNASSVRKAFMRIPALLVTLALELMVAACFTGLIDTFMKYPLLIAFQPVISAISGNVGLQASSANVRALALCLFGPKDFKQGVWPETKAAFAVAVAIGGLTGCVAMVWSTVVSPSSGGSSSARGALAFGLAVFCGMLFSVMLAGISGSAAPLLFKMCKFDPSSLAGPLETAIQDIVGGTVLLMLSAYILGTLGDKVQECPGGSGEACLEECKQLGFLVKDCVLECMGYVDSKVCSFHG